MVLGVVMRKLAFGEPHPGLPSGPLQIAGAAACVHHDPAAETVTVVATAVPVSKPTVASGGDGGLVTNAGTLTVAAPAAPAVSATSSAATGIAMRLARSTALPMVNRRRRIGPPWLEKWLKLEGEWTKRKNCLERCMKERALS
jgi:hypothetical protein